MSNDRSRRPRATDRSSRENAGDTPAPQPSAPSSGSAGGSRRASSRRSTTPASSSARTPTPATATARNRAEERIRERKQEQRRQRVTTIGIGVAILVGLIIVAALSRNLPADAPIPPETRARYDGLTANRTDEGYPELGESIIEVALYTSFDCAPCGTFHNQVTEGLTQRVRAGDISLVYVPLYATGNITNGQGATRAAICVAEQDPSAFWELQDAFFAWQTQFGNQAYTDPRIRGLIEQLDIDSGAFYGCLNSDRTNRVLETAQSQARALANYDGTPVVAINGIIPTNEDGAITEPEALFAVIDERIAGRQVQPDADAQATPEAERTPEAETTAEFTQSP